MLKDHKTFVRTTQIYSPGIEKHLWIQLANLYNIERGIKDFQNQRHMANRCSHLKKV